MPAAVAFSVPAQDREALRLKRFTRAEVAQMMELGMFAGQRYELFEGELIDKMGQNPPHAVALDRLMDLLLDVFGRRRVRVQVPIEVSGPDVETSEPEPDLSVIPESFNLDALQFRHPNARELVLAVEISDTTIKFDATRKRDLYARAGLREYWVLDLNTSTLLIHRKPNDQGQYAETLLFTRTESVTVAGSSIAIAKMLAPPQPA